MHLVNHLVRQKLITPPAWLPDNVHYLAVSATQSAPGTVPVARPWGFP
jgi:hypothetical protein